jgi:Zn-dependent peptidase ImmA (M78 family)/DNA-binding XRE family transcriptional regulator
MQGNKFNSEKLVEARMARGLTQAQLAKYLGIDRQSMYRYEKGTAPRPELREKIADVLEVPSGFFSDYRNEYIEEQSTIHYRKYASTKIIEREQIKVQNHWVYKIYKLLSNYVAFPLFDLPGNIMKLTKEDFYTEDEIEIIASTLRKEWNLSDEPIKNLAQLLESKGIIIGNRISYSDQTAKRVDACSELIEGRPFIFIEHDKSSARLRFSLAHELGHIILHKYVTEHDLEDKKTYKKIEAEAFYFAGAFLLPSTSFANEVWSTKLEHLVSLKKRWRVSIQAMIMRANKLGLYSHEQKENLIISMGRKKIRTNEPLDDIIPIEHPVLFKQAFSLILKSGKETISSIKWKIGLNGDKIEMLSSLPLEMLEKKIEEPIPHLRLVK